MQEIYSDENTQETIDKFFADFGSQLNTAEADKAEQAENALSPEQFEAMMEEYAAFIDVQNAELDANAPTPDEFEALMDEYFAAVGSIPEPLIEILE